MKIFLLVFGLLAIGSSSLTVSGAPVDGKTLNVNKNVLDVPNVCGPGEAADLNGRCRPIHRSQQDLRRKQTLLYLACLIERQTNFTIDCSPKSVTGVNPQSVIDVPPTCPQGQLPDLNGRCRPIHRKIEFRGVE